MSRLLHYPLRQWPALLAIYTLTILASASAVLQPWPMKILADHALDQAAIPAALSSLFNHLHLSPTPVVLIVTAAGASLGLLALNSVLDVGLTWVWSVTGQRMVYDLAEDLFHQLQRLSLLFSSRRTVGDLLSRLTGDTWCIYTITDACLIAPWKHLLTLATLSTIAWRLNPHLAVLSLAVAPVMTGATRFFGPRLKRQALQNREVGARLLSFVHQTLTAIPLIQAFGTEAWNRRQFQQLANEAVAISQRNTLVKNTYGFVNDLSTTIGMAVVLFAGGQQVLGGTLSVGSLLVFLAYFRSIEGALKGLLKIYGNLKSAEVSIDRVLEVFEEESTVREAPDARPLPTRPAHLRGYVHLDHVTFGYERGCPVLKDVTLEARPGEMVALIGASGAGKSTLVSLIPRFFDPWYGRVLIDGLDVRDVQLASLRAQIALVLQEPFLLPLTVAENIAYGRPEASRAEIVAAAGAAGADAFIRRLPNGYDTRLGEHGATLSGGQRQRLAIARALLKDAPILILDEPTSALDAETEAAVMTALERLMEDRTTIIIAHRLSAIRRADWVVVLDDGVVL